MAQFRVGQRVRIIKPSSPLYGKEATIWGIERGNWNAMSIAKGIPDDAMAHRLAVDGVGIKWPRGYGRVVGDFIAYEAHNIAPLTDPGVDAFMERIKKLGDEPINAVEKEGVK